MECGDRVYRNQDYHDLTQRILAGGAIDVGKLMLFFRSPNIYIIVCTPAIAAYELLGWLVTRHRIVIRLQREKEQPAYGMHAGIHTLGIVLWMV